MYGPHWKQISGRQTGRTTQQMFEWISTCMENPNRTYKIWDHHGTQKASKLLMIRMKDLVEMLELQGFNFDFAQLKVTYCFDNTELEKALAE